jgi:hypothetical protein
MTSTLSLWKTLSSGNGHVKMTSANSSLFMTNDGTLIYRSSPTTADPVEWFTSNFGNLGGIAVDAANNCLYVIANYNKIKRVNCGADWSNPTLDSDFEVYIPTAHFLVVRNGILYAGCVDSSCVVAVNISTKTADTNWITGLARPMGLTINGNNLYVITNDNTIKKITIANDGVGTLVSGFTSGLPLGAEPTSLTNDGYYLYAGNKTTSSVIKVDINTGVLVSDSFVSLYTLSLHYFDSKLYMMPGNSTIHTIGIAPPVPPITPIYLGNSIINNTGNFNFGDTILSSTRYPQNNNELVPRAYVDTYVSSVVEYYNGILEPNANHTSALDRITYLEAQLERVYQVLWGVSKNIASITAVHTGPLAANYVSAGSGNADLMDGEPTAPASLPSFN